MNGKINLLQLVKISSSLSEFHTNFKSIFVEF